MNEPGDTPHRPLTKEEEERKRDAVLAKNPALRWRLLQEAIAFAEANTPPERRRNRPRLPHQR